MPRLTFINFKRKSFAIFAWILGTCAHKSVIFMEKKNIILDVLLLETSYLEDVLLVESTEIKKKSIF